jgi:predicted permease
VGTFSAEGQDLDEVRGNPSLNFEVIRPNYFATLGVTILRGRAFTEADRRDAPEVVILTEDLTERLWPGEDPIGKRLKFGPPDEAEPWRTVVGVVVSTRYRELADPRPTLYMPAQQLFVSATILVLRTGSPLSLVADLVRQDVRAVDPDVEVTWVAPFSQFLDRPLARPRFNALLIGLFALAALVLAVVGLYAVMGTFVRQRHAELGVRMALGASASDVRRLVLGEGLRLAGLGAALGLGAAVAASRLLQGFLFGVDPLDPVSLLGAAALLVGAAVLASCLPARRAMQVDPGSLLRAM